MKNWLKYSSLVFVIITSAATAFKVLTDKDPSNDREALGAIANIAEEVIETITGNEMADNPQDD